MVKCEDSHKCHPVEPSENNQAYDLYMLGILGANLMISQLADDDRGTFSGASIPSHFFRFDLGLAKEIQLQNLLFIQNELRNAGQFPSFFVPMGAYTPRQYRFQEQTPFIF